MPDCNCNLCYLSVSCLDANYLLNVCLLAVCFSTVWLSALCLSVCCLPVWNPPSDLQLGAMVRISLSPCCIYVCVSAFPAVCLLTVRSLSVLHSTVCLISVICCMSTCFLCCLYICCIYIVRRSVCYLLSSVSLHPVTFLYANYLLLSVCLPALPADCLFPVCCLLFVYSFSAFCMIFVCLLSLLFVLSADYL